MFAICAWCQAEGRHNAVLGMREPFTNCDITHGICPEHYAAAQIELTAWRQKLAEQKAARQE